MLMGVGLATSTGSLIVVGASLLAGITWWLETQSEFSSKTETLNNFLAGLQPYLDGSGFRNRNVSSHTLSLFYPPIL